MYVISAMHMSFHIKSATKCVWYSVVSDLLQTLCPWISKNVEWATIAGVSLPIQGGRGISGISPLQAESSSLSHLEKQSHKP